MPSIPRPVMIDGSFHNHMLRDRARLDAFADGINAIVREGDVVADIGSGSGILAALAIRAGARRAYAVELNTYSFDALVRNVRRNGLQGKVIPVLGDGTEWQPPTAVDVVVCELMETGMLHEPIAAIMRNVHGWRSKPRVILPERVELLVEGVEQEDVFRGYRATYGGWRSSKAEPALTDRTHYGDYTFLDAPPAETVDGSFQLQANDNGMLNALQIFTRTTTAPGITHLWSPGLCTPAVLPLDEAIPVQNGTMLDGRIHYEFDYTDNPLEYDLVKSK